MKKTIIQEYSVLKPLFINDKEIHAIKFYSNGEVIASTNCGWLEIGILEDSIALTIEEPKKAIKLNLNRKDNFYIKCKERHYEEEVDLYINLNEFSYFTVEEKEWQKSKERIDYRLFVSFKFNAGNNYETKKGKFDTFNGFMGFVTKSIKTEYGEEKAFLYETLKNIFKLDYLYISDDMLKKFNDTFSKKEAIKNE